MAKAQQKESTEAISAAAAKDKAIKKAEIEARAAAAAKAIANPPTSSSAKTPVTYIEKFRAKHKLSGMKCWENTSLGKSIQFGGTAEITTEMLTQLIVDGYVQNELKPLQFFHPNYTPNAEVKVEVKEEAQSEES